MTLEPIPALCALTAAELSRMLARGETTSVAITEAYLDAIHARDGRIHAYLEVFDESALTEARASDSRRAAGEALSPLDGVPIAVKDNIVIKDRICSCASKMLADFVSPYDATVIRRIRAAGMPILGRLNMDEFAMGSSTENSAFGVTRNPFDLTRVPGGSSGGAAAAVSAGVAPLALGSDTGGSIRQPAAFCGVMGVKPAYGAVSRFGLVAFASSLDQIGPLAKTTEDAALLLDIICGADEHDMTSDPALTCDHAAALTSTDLSGLRVGLPKECFGEGLQPEMRERVLAAADALRALGAEVREVSVPTLPYALSAYYVISGAEASSNLARFDGVRYGARAKEYEDLDDLYRQTRGMGFGAEVKRRIMLGTFVLSSGYQDRYYLKALEVRDALRAEMNEALESCDMLLSPVTPTPAYKLGEKTADPMEMYLGDVYTVPANITGLPAVSVPCGLTRDGLPVSMSLMGARGGLNVLLRAANAYEQAQKPLEGQHPYDKEVR